MSSDKLVKEREDYKLHRTRKNVAGFIQKANFE
jgi:hypothetical protein